LFIIMELTCEDTIKKKINSDIDTDEFYIHFNTPLICDKFISTNNVQIGHRCCSKKGVLLKSFDNEKIANYNHIKRIEREYHKL